MTFKPGFAWMSCSFPSRSTTIIRAIEISVKQPLGRGRRSNSVVCRNLIGATTCGCNEAPRKLPGAGCHAVLSGFAWPAVGVARQVELAPEQADVVVQPRQLIEAQIFTRRRRAADVGRQKIVPEWVTEIVVGAPARQIPVG